MRTQAKSMLMLLGTLSMGVLLGAAGNGTVQRERRESAEQIRRPDGFVEHVMMVIRPRDEAQRNALLPTVQATGERNRQIMETAHTQLRAALDTMRTRLAPRLDAEQRQRLERFAQMAPPPGMPHHDGPGMHHGPGMHGAPGGPPHEGWGPPPPPPLRDGASGPPPRREGDGNAPPPPAPSGQPARPQN